MRLRLPILLLTLCALAATTPLLAANGNILHGFGPVNSALGGAGTAAGDDAVAALVLNPALLGTFERQQVDLGLELLATTSEVSSGVGPFSGRTEHDGDADMIPSLGWVRRLRNDRLTFGAGLVGVAGFGTHYPADATNPVLAPQPNGFGEFTSHYQLARIPLALAYRVNDRLIVGGAVFAAIGNLEVAPAGFAGPDCSATGCFYPAADAEMASGFGAEIGLVYRTTDRLTLGAAYTTATRFRDFEWSARTPAGGSREFAFRLDAPPSFSIGLAYAATPRLLLVLDGKWIGFGSTAGLGDRGVTPTGRVLGLGWKDVRTFAFGASFQATDALTLRAGVNRSSSPIPSEQSFFNVGTPGVFQTHLAAGIGFRVRPTLVLNAGYYHTLRNDVTGPIMGPSGPVPSSHVTNSIELNGFLIGFSKKL